MEPARKRSRPSDNPPTLTYASVSSGYCDQLDDDDDNESVHSWQSAETGKLFLKIKSIQIINLIVFVNQFLWVILEMIGFHHLMKMWRKNHSLNMNYLMKNPLSSTAVIRHLP